MSLKAVGSVLAPNCRPPLPRLRAGLGCPRWLRYVPLSIACVGTWQTISAETSPERARQFQIIQPITECWDMFSRSAARRACPLGSCRLFSQTERACGPT
ncbi:hypothetical protein BaRGS_00030990 [Batillaria attramentaria]|uniref:Secreted protein n=1 Tax=Batillaria attramentaria TaxID=370345 RepID=A0ABD0JSH5_9CAEN